MKKVGALFLGMTQSSACKIFVLSFVLLLSPQARCDDQTTLVYAGFAFSGDYSNKQVLYPYSAELAEEQSSDGALLLDKTLRERILTRPELAKRLSFELAGSSKDSTTALAFALVSEKVELQKIYGKYIETVTLQANILAFNKASYSVVASYPVRVSSPQEFDAPPTPAETLAQVRSVYYGSSDPASINLIDVWLDKLAKISIKEGAKNYIRVTDIQFTPEAEAFVTNAGQNVNALKNQIANLLEDEMSDISGVPFVPNSVGQAIGGKIAYRFQNGDAFDLTLPTPDYEVQFRVRGFAGQTVNDPGVSSDIYRAKGTIIVTQPDLGKTYVNEDVYNTIVEQRPANANRVYSDWDQYDKTLQQLLYLVAKQVSAPDNAWLDKYASREQDARAGFVAVSELLNKVK